jgi:putative ABC transport system permease protein
VSRIRIALGASPSGILRLVLGQSGGLALTGGAIGLGAAIVLGAVVRANLVGVPGIDPLFFLAAAGLLAAAMSAASLVPARRAARVDPIASLRQE